MADSKDSTGNDVHTTQDILKMSGNAELKFGVLIGLIQVGQVSNKDVVDTVLNLVSRYFWCYVCIKLHSSCVGWKWACHETAHVFAKSVHLRICHYGQVP